jgi:hypothetical protein
MIPTSMGAHKLEVRKGSRNDIIDWTGILDPALNINAGMVCSINLATGRLRPGLLAADGLSQCPLFAWSGTDINNYPDVRREGSLSGPLNNQVRSNPSGGSGYAMPYAGEARFGTIAWRAAVELSTTAFNPAVNYAVGQPLTCVAAGNANAGILRPTAAATDIVVARVAPAGRYTSPDGYATLAIYPVLENVAAGLTLPAAL